VEYNQLGGLLQANGKTDSNDPATGFSPFPGNTNQLILRMKPYLETLRETNGVVAEFVNPKYADAERTTFKKATRLECMMQVRCGTAFRLQLTHFVAKRVLAYLLLHRTSHWRCHVELPLVLRRFPPLLILP